MTPEIKRRIEQIQNENVPDGYKKLNISNYIVPADWSEIHMDKLFKRLTRKNTVKNTNVLTISAQHGLINQQDFFNKTVASEDKSNYFLLQKGDFAYNKSYSTGYPFGAVKVLEKYESGIVSPLYICFEKTEKNKCSDYYLHYFEGGFANREIRAFAQEGARNHGLLNIAAEDFFNMSLVCPPLPEQQKISKILYAQDKVIALKQNLLQEKKQQKKYLMQKLLSADGTSFMLDGVKIDKSLWKNEKLGNILEFKNGVNSEKDKYGHGIKMISVMDILSEQPITFNSIKNSVEISEEDLKIYSVCNGDIIFQRSSENYEDVGKSNVYLDEKTATFSGFVIRGKKKHDYYPLCLNAILKTVSIRKQIMKKAAGAQHINIGQDSLASIIIKLPSLPEQQVIAKVLSAADKEIELLQKSIEQEKQKKKALMQLLLSGIVRVKIEEK